jgi:CheY-like chemotaxis protein
MPNDILVLVDDLFFSAKIDATARSCGVSVEFVKTGRELLEKVRSGSPRVVILDLNGSTTQPLEVIQNLKSDPELKLTPVLGFFSHVQTELKEKALAWGCDSVIPRSLFSQRLAEILREHSQIEPV